MSRIMDGDAYSALEARFDRIGRLEESTAVLLWDQATVMPTGGADARAGQLATLDGLAHELLTHPAVGEQLAAAEASRSNLDPWQTANLREMRRRWRRATAVPGDLVEALARARSGCEMTWRDARARDDFAALAPDLAGLLSLVREEARCKAEALGLSPYDALLDGFDPGLREARFAPLFDDLAGFLPGLLAEVLERQPPAPPSPRGPFPAERQREAARRFMAALGFEFDHGRLDESHHPFTGGVPDDVRITSRWDESDFLTGWMAVLHETGHALYQRALPERWRRQPVGDARGMTLHESQSLLLEMQVCRSAEFLEFATPILRDVFGGTGEAWTAASLGRLQRRVAPGMIRVDADEVTYPLHVILRFRLERSMIGGTCDRPISREPGTRGCATSSGSRPGPTARDASRTSTGLRAPSGTSPPIRWARSRPPSSSPPRARRSLGCRPRSPAATSLRSSRGCGITSMAWAADWRPTRSWKARPDDRLGPRPSSHT